MKLATLVFITKGNEVLLGWKKMGEFASEQLNGYGGKVEPGESAIESSLREIHEEVGIELIPDKLEYAGFLTSFRDGVEWFRVHIYRTDVYEGEPIETDEMIPEWHPIDSIPYSRMPVGTDAWLPKVFSGEEFQVDVHHLADGKTLTRTEFRPLSAFE